MIEQTVLEKTLVEQNLLEQKLSKNCTKHQLLKDNGFEQKLF